MSREDLQLQQGFELFVAAAHELEEGYRDLKARVAAVDLELRDTNRALKRSLDEREAVFAAMPIGLVTVREDGATRICNREGERLCGIADEAGVDLVARPTGEVDIGGVVVRVRREALPDGELVLLEDRSQLRKLEHEVDRLDRLAGLSELALGIAHEIRNPLNGVAGFAELLARSKDPGAQKRFADKILQGVRQVDGIVRAMLGFARPGRKEGRIKALSEILAEAAADSGLPLERIRFIGCGEAKGDADALVRVIGNLFRNSVEARSDVTVRVRATVRAGWLEIEVCDDGPGVDGRLGQRALEPMVSGKERGSGLGLSLASRVLSFLGGELRLLNPGEAGARFLVKLPAAAGCRGTDAEEAAT